MYHEFMDKKIVKFLSTIHSYLHVVEGTVKKRWDKETKKHVDISFSQVKTEYDSHMGGVDKVDHLESLVRIPYRFRRPHMVNYIFHFETALTTAHQLNKLAYPEAYTSAKGRTKRTLQDDMIDLVKQLLAYAKDNEEEDDPVRELSADHKRKARLPLAKDHWIDKMPGGKKGRCAVCEGSRQIAAGKSSHPVRNGCPLCQKYFCCSKCFSEFHDRNTKGYEELWT